MPFLDHLLTYKITAYNTRHQRGRKLSIGGLITPILCAAGVNPTDRRATEPVGHEDDCEPELDRAESRAEVELRIELNIRSRRADLGKAIEKMQKSMDKMVSKIKSLEKKVSGSSSKKKSKAPTFPRSSHSSPLQEGSLPKSLTEPLLSSQEKERTTRREGGRVLRPDAPARPPDSIESNQRKLNSIELTVELTEEPQFEIRDFEYDQPSTRTSLRDGPLQASSEHKLHQGQGSHTHFEDEEERKRSHKLDRVSRTQLSGVLLMAVSHLQTTT
ncbi:unnamed protein product [Microthlaspi erraticum]|uniref:Arabidopsis retrotransposon Orf1 C-terminal domain-containing protein n=1 Tax=Microthlaspi erraticum TaxID=1685480 RepID=A0A6D2I0L8_9BRAS|nr:unnamed protein product [Microthlaspi erraticum]